MPSISMFKDTYDLVCHVGGIVLSNKPPPLSFDKVLRMELCNSKRSRWLRERELPMTTETLRKLVTQNVKHLKKDD